MEGGRSVRREGVAAGVAALLLLLGAPASALAVGTVTFTVAPPNKTVPSLDTTAPVCTMSAPGTIGDPSRAITVTETCNEPSSLQVTLTAQLSGRVVASRAGDVILAERSLSRRSGRVRVTLRIARRFRAALGRRASITVRVAATDAGGNRTVRSRTIRLRRR